MRIRPANLADIDACQSLDAGYATDHVWRVQGHTGQEGTSASLAVRRTLIPRLVHVDYPRPRDELYEDLQRKECFLVADEAHHVLGFIDVRTEDGDDGRSSSTSSRTRGSAAAASPAGCSWPLCVGHRAPTYGLLLPSCRAAMIQPCTFCVTMGLP